MFNLQKIRDLLIVDLRSEEEKTLIADTGSEEELEKVMGIERHLQGWQNMLFTVISILMAWFHIYYMTIGFAPTIALRSGHVMFAMVLGFMLHPFSKKRSSRKSFSLSDALLCIAALVCGFYIIYIYKELVWRVGDLYFREVVLGTILIVLTLELTRRIMGWALVIVALCALAYVFLGPLLPDLIAHQGEDLERLASNLYCSLEGIYGVPTGVMVSFIYLFILFGAFLIKTGAGSFFMDVAFSLTGKMTGGPAKAAVLGSACMSMINGSSQANVVTTGVFTIPLMKRVGYPDHIAAAIETAASAGGIFTPPIMGAAAFIMAEWLGIPYITILKAAALPAFLFFASLFIFVHTQAKKLKLQPSENIERIEFRRIWRRGCPFICSVGMLIVFLVAGYSPQYTVLLSMGCLIVVSSFFKETRMSLTDFIEALVLAAKNTLLASAACAVAGIVIGVVGITGLGLKFTSLILALSGGNLLLGLVLMFFASLILGMGLTVAPAYITLAVLGGAALVQLGLSPLAAHMIIFWFSQDSQVTPPVCVTAYTAAAVARSDPFKTGISAWALCKGLYVVPIFMAFTPILEGTLGQMLFFSLICLLSLIALNGVIHGYLLRKAKLYERIACAVSAFCLIYPDYRTWILGAAILAAWIMFQKFYTPQSLNIS